MNDRRRTTVLFALLITLASLTLPAAPAHADAAGRGGDFVPFPTPGILLDTRNGTGAAAGVRSANSETVFQATGRAGVPTSGVRALLLGLIQVAPSASTYLVAWPDGTAMPGVSMTNGPAGATVNNVAVVAPGSNGRIRVSNRGGSTHIVVQVRGYYTADSGTSGYGGFRPVTQTRVVDTRSGLGAPKAKIAAGNSLTVTLGNGAPVPASATAAMVNITVTDATASGYVAAYPAGGSIGTANSVINYLTGHTASAGAFKLGTGGQVTFVNKGGAAVNLVLDALGYFSAQPTEGAGLRTVVAARLIDTRTTGTPVAAGASIDVAVGGTNGLPTRGIAGAALNLTVTSTTAAGYLTAWPTGSAEPLPTSLTNFPASSTRASLAVVRPGAQGKVRVRNHSGGALHLVVDLQGWFADPLPPVAVRSYTPTAAVQGAPAAGALVGALAYAYVDNIGRVVHGHQADPNNVGSVQWTVLSGNEAFSGPPTLGVQPDGRLQLGSQHTGSNVWTLTQTSGGTAWGTWIDNGGSMATAPTVGRRPDGSLVLFAVDVDGALWHLPQASVNGPYSWWRQLSDIDLTAAPAVAAGRDVLHLFGVDISGTVHTATFTATGTLSAWTSLGGSGVSGMPAVVVYPGYKMRVFVRSGDGSILTKVQDDAGVWPTGWSPVGSLVAAGSPAAVLSPLSGKTEVVVRGGDGGIYSTGETLQGSGVWREWVPVLQFGDLAATDPTVLTYNDGFGLRWAFMFRTADQQSRLYTVDTGLSALAVETDAAGPSFRATRLPAPPR